MIRVAAAAGPCAAAFAWATALLGGLARPGYDPCSQFISELGESGAPHAAWVGFAGFLPTGLLTLAFSLFAAARSAPTPRARWGWLLFSAVGWAYVASVFFPCDPGCPPSGSPSQQIHNAFGAAEYLLGGAGLVLLAGARPAALRMRGGRALALAAATVVFVAFAGMLVPPLAEMRGLFQRAAEVALFLWLVLCGLELWRLGPSDAASGGLVAS